MISLKSTPLGSGVAGVTTGGALGTGDISTNSPLGAGGASTGMGAGSGKAAESGYVHHLLIEFLRVDRMSSQAGEFVLQPF